MLAPKMPLYDAEPNYNPISHTSPAYENSTMLKLDEQVSFGADVISPFSADKAAEYEQIIDDMMDEEDLLKFSDEPFLSQQPLDSSTNFLE